MNKGGFTPFQRKVHKMLIRRGWEHVGFTNKGYAKYLRPGANLLIVSSTPKSPDNALKQVIRWAEKLEAGYGSQ